MGNSNGTTITNLFSISLKQLWIWMESGRRLAARIVSCSIKHLKVLLSGCIQTLRRYTDTRWWRYYLSNILVEKILENQQPYEDKHETSNCESFEETLPSDLSNTSKLSIDFVGIYIVHQTTVQGIHIEILTLLARHVETKLTKHKPHKLIRNM